MTLLVSKTSPPSCSCRDSACSSLMCDTLQFDDDCWLGPRRYELQSQNPPLPANVSKCPEHHYNVKYFNQVGGGQHSNRKKLLNTSLTFGQDVILDPGRRSNPLYIERCHAWILANQKLWQLPQQ